MNGDFGPPERVGWVVCETCDGSGNRYTSIVNACPDCDGQGEVPPPERSGEPEDYIDEAAQEGPLTGEGRDENESYRASMIDAGRGRLLR